MFRVGEVALTLRASSWAAFTCDTLEAGSRRWNRLCRRWCCVGCDFLKVGELQKWAASYGTFCRFDRLPEIDMVLTLV